MKERNPSQGDVFRHNKTRTLRRFEKQFGDFVAYRTEVKRQLRVVFRSEWRKWAANSTLQRSKSNENDWNLHGG